MQALRIRNVKIRNNFYKAECLKKLYRFLFINLLNNNNIKKSSLNIKKNRQRKIKSQMFSLYFLNKLQNISMKSSVKNICVLTNRSKAVNKHYSISRLKLKEFMDFGILPGYRKRVW